MATTFIYALCEPGTRKVRYIGKADKPEGRLRQHLSTSLRAKTHLGNWLRSLGVEKPALIVLREVPSDQWEVAEERYIRLAKGLGMDLVNGSGGGEGVVNPSPETRAKLSARTRGEKNPMFGRTGEKCPMFGEPKSPETRAKLSAANLGKHHTPESRAKMSEARSGEGNPMFGKPQAPKVRAALLAANLGKKNSPETRAKKSAARLGEKNPQFGNLGWTHTEETKAKMRASQLAQHARKREAKGIN